MIKPPISLVLLATLAAAGSAHAAPTAAATPAVTSAPEPSATHRALAEKALVAMRTEQNMKNSMELVRRSMAGMTHKMIGEAVGAEVKPGDVEEMQAAQAAAIAIVEKELAWDVIKDDLIALYAEIYTEAELRAMIAFYSTPEGVAILDKTPAATAKSVELIQKRMQSVMPKILAETKKHTDAIRAARHPESAPAP